jgi:hypothetical protein
MVPALALSAAAAPAAAPAASAPAGSVWTATSQRPPSDASVHPSAYKGYKLAADRMQATLDKAPSEDAGRAGTRVSVPSPGGGLVAFDVVQTQLFEPGLAADHPEITTYAGKAVGSNASIVIDMSPWGFHASVRGSGASWFVDPASAGDPSLYLSYRGDSLPTPEQPLVEPELDDTTVAKIERLGEGPDQLVSRRTYRLALLTDPTYAEYIAPGLNDGAHEAESNSAVLAGKTTLMNRVNQIYTNDLAVRMVFVNDTDKLNLNTVAKARQGNGPCGTTACYTDAQLDPAATSTNGCTSGLLTRNRWVLGQLIGAGNFDIGHIALGMNGGGIASLGVVGGNNKAQGCTGVPTPVGDYYAIDYVAHEMGHQFSGNHTFNGTQVNCSTSNRNAGTSVEPGSGSSVMAYAGICVGDDLQPHTDPYFSQRSQQEITNYTTSTVANVNEVQQAALTGFNTNGYAFTLTFPGLGTTAPIVRGSAGAGQQPYTAAGIKAAVEAVTGATVTATAFFATSGAPSDSGFVLTYTGALAGTDVPNPTLNVTSGTWSGFANDIAKGGAPTNGGALDQSVTNHAPTVEAPANKYIPIRTPFTLTGSATDSDGDSLIYLWEQNDVGAAGTSGGTALQTQPKVNGPLFRVFGKYADVPDAASQQYSSPGENLATTDPSRTFPDMEQILAGDTNAATGSCPTPVATDYENDQPTRDLTAQGFGIVANTLKDGPVLECLSEFLPTSAYNGTAAAGNTEPSLNFRLTVRDQNPTAGGYQFADTKLRIDKSAGPFLVTSQATPTTYDAGTTQTITWDVNGTNKPVLAPNVKISFSDDAGQTFDEVLAASTPNDGSADVTIPAVGTTTGRIKIEAVGNYFFDVNDAPITVVRHFAVTESVPSPVNVQYSDTPAISFSATSDFGAVVATPSGLPAGLALTRTPATDPGTLPSSASWAVTGTVTAAPGTYPVTFTIDDGASDSGTDTEDPEVITTSIVVAAEDATVTYTGDSSAEAPHAGTDVVDVTLSAHVTPSADGSSGDVTTATVTFEDSTADEVLCADVPVNASGDATCTYDADVPTASGRSYALELTVEGNYTGSGTGSLEVTVDTTAPETTITSGPADGSLLMAGSTSFGFTSNDPGATFTCLVDGVSQSCPSSPVSLTGLSRKTHTFSVAAKDEAGNTDATPATRTFTVPLDDADLRFSFGKWKHRSSGAAYLGSYSQVKQKNASFNATVVKATSLSLIVGKAPKAGKVKVYLNGVLLKTISLKGANSLGQVVQVASFATPQTGSLLVQTANKKQVRIDGLAVVSAS